MSNGSMYNEGFEAIYQSQVEVDRLNALNARLRDWSNGKITIAPVELANVRSVLELGAGSGAWMLDAAAVLPGAQIMACDLTPLPDSVVLPANACFDIVDITGELPYKPASFDLIHIRLVLIHVQSAADILIRVIALLRPNGWVVVEEPDNLDRDAEGNLRGLAKYVSAMAQVGEETRRRGLEFDIGRRIERILRDLPVLYNIGGQKLDIPFTGVCEDGKLSELGQVYKMNILTLIERGTLSGRFTQQQYEEAQAVMQDELIRPYARLYLTWAQKRSQ